MSLDLTAVGGVIFVSIPTIPCCAGVVAWELLHRDLRYLSILSGWRVGSHCHASGWGRLQQDDKGIDGGLPY
jgi:hypothetical protein